MHTLNEVEVETVAGADTDGGCVQNPNDLQRQDGETYQQYIARTRFEG